jgi:hypothetical protein
MFLRFSLINIQTCPLMVVGEGRGGGGGEGGGVGGKGGGRRGEAGCQFVSFRRDFKPHPGKSCFRLSWRELKTTELKCKESMAKVVFSSGRQQKNASKNKGRDGACSKATYKLYSRFHSVSETRSSVFNLSQTIC